MNTDTTEAAEGGESRTKDSLCAYIEKMHPGGFISYKTLNPTGRWKIESGPYYENQIFIEHKGFLFNRWIPELDIEFKAKESTQVFCCT